MNRHHDGSAHRWGPLFGSHARVWAETWEGPDGWGTNVYEHVLRSADVGRGTTVLDCGCGAGRFVELAGQRGAEVSGIDASTELVEIASDRWPNADLRDGDFESLPWPDGSFDVVTGFSTFQFADDHVRAFSEARRVARGRVWTAIPTRLAEFGIAQVFSSLKPLFPANALEDFKRSGMFALSAPGTLDDVVSKAGLVVGTDATIDTQIDFPDVDTAVLAFLSAGATTIAVQQSGQLAVATAISEALAPFADGNGQVTLSGSFRVIEAS